MRISVEKDDPGYTDLVPLLGLKIFLDGQEEKLVLTADEEQGKILVAVKNEAGFLQKDGDEILKEWKSGKVEIQFPEKFPREQFEALRRAQ